MFSRAAADLEKVILAHHAPRLPALARVLRATAAAFTAERAELEPLADDEDLQEVLWDLAVSLVPKVIKRGFNEKMLQEARSTAPTLTAIVVDAADPDTPTKATR